MPETRYQLDELSDEERRKLGLGFKSRAQAAIKRRYVEGAAMLQDMLAGGQSEEAAAAVEAARRQAAIMEAGASWPERTFLGALGSTSMLPLHVLGAGVGGPIGGAISSIMAAGAEPYWTHRLAGHEYSRALADAAVQGAIEMIGFDLAKHTLFNPAISAVQKLGRMGGIAAAGEVLEEEAQNLTGKLFDPYKSTQQAFSEAARESPLVAGQTLAQLAAIPLVAIPGAGGVQSQPSMIGRVPAERIEQLNLDARRGAFARAYGRDLPPFSALRRGEAAAAVEEAVHQLRAGKDPAQVKHWAEQNAALEERPAIRKLITEVIVPNYAPSIHGPPKERLLHSPIRQTGFWWVKNVYSATPLARANELAHRIAGDEAGFTVDANGNEPSKGFAVAAFPDRGVRDLIANGVAPEQIIDFARQNEFLLRQPGNFIGGWRDAVNGGVYLDIARVFSKREDAEDVARAFGELAIYDLAKKEEIRLDYKPEELANLSRQPWLSGMEPPKVVTQGGARPVQARPPQPGETIAHIPNTPGLGLPSGYSLVEKQPGVQGDTARLGLRRFEVRGPAFPQGTSEFGTSPQDAVRGIAQHIQELEAMNASAASSAERSGSIENLPESQASQPTGEPSATGQRAVGSEYWGTIENLPYGKHSSAFRGLDPNRPEDLFELERRVRSPEHGRNVGRAIMVREVALGGDWREVLADARNGNLTKGSGDRIPLKAQAWFLREFVPWLGQGRVAQAQQAIEAAASVPSPSRFQLQPPPGRVSPPRTSTETYQVVQLSKPIEISPTRTPARAKKVAPELTLTQPGADTATSNVQKPDVDLMRRVSKYIEAVKMRDYSKLPKRVSKIDVENGEEVGGGIHHPSIVNVDGKQAFAKLMFEHEGENGRGELAGYEASIILGITRVPTRIDHDEDQAIVVKTVVPDDAELIYRYSGDIDPKSGMDLFALDMLGDIRDRHRANTLVMPGGKVVPIDMDSAFGEFHLDDNERHYLWHKLREQNTEADASMFVKIVDRRAILETRLDEVSGHPGWVKPRIDIIEKIVDKLKLRENPVVNLEKLEREIKRSGLRPYLDPNVY